MKKKIEKKKKKKTSKIFRHFDIMFGFRSFLSLCIILVASLFPFLTGRFIEQSYEIIGTSLVRCCLLLLFFDDKFH